MGEPESVCMAFSRREKFLFPAENQESVFPFHTIQSSNTTYISFSFMQLRTRQKRHFLNYYDKKKKGLVYEIIILQSESSEVYDRLRNET
jgi:hypothetical protein